MALVQWRLLAPMWSALTPPLALGAALLVAVLVNSYTASECGGNFLKWNEMWAFWPYYVCGYLARGRCSRELHALLEWRASHVVARGASRCGGAAPRRVCCATISIEHRASSRAEPRFASPYGTTC